MEYLLSYVDIKNITINTHHWKHMNTLDRVVKPDLFEVCQVFSSKVIHKRIEYKNMFWSLTYIQSKVSILYMSGMPMLIILLMCFIEKLA